MSSNQVRNHLFLNLMERAEIFSFRLMFVRDEIKKFYGSYSGFFLLSYDPFFFFTDLQILLTN